MKRFLISISIFYSTISFGDTWNDEDGDIFVSLNYPYIEISSTNNFYYFDKIFDAVREGENIILCIGNADRGDRETDCFIRDTVEVDYRNDGYVRVIKYKVSNSDFAFEAFEHYLFEGHQMRLTLEIWKDNVYNILYNWLPNLTYSKI
jgi:hypothetical protein